MVSEGKGRLFRRKDGKYLIYLPLDLAEDSMFPFKEFQTTRRGAESIPVRVSFQVKENKLCIDKWTGPD